MSFRARLTLFFLGMVLFPLVAAGAAAHLIASREAARDADAKLQAVVGQVEAAQRREIRDAQRDLSRDVAMEAAGASVARLEAIRNRAILDYLVVERSGSIAASSMRPPSYVPGITITPRLLAGLPGRVGLVAEHRVDVVGDVRVTVWGGRFLDRFFLGRLGLPVLTAARGRIVASTGHPSPIELVTETGGRPFDVPGGRRGVCVCTGFPPSGVVVMAHRSPAGLLGSIPGWMLAVVLVGVVIGTSLAYSLARVLSRPHERALGRLAETELLSVTDELTGTWNRRHLDRVLAEEVKRGGRFGHSFSVLMLDVDHFKRINDERGHATGDRVLAEMASRVRAEIRVDLDVLARFGGEEFTVVLPQTGPDGAMAAAEKIREAVAARPFEGGLPVSMSIGVASYPWDGATPDELVHAADEALYEAKRAGRNRVVART